jgi:hypothetical protein
MRAFHSSCVSSANNKTKDLIAINRGNLVVLVLEAGRDNERLAAWKEKESYNS